MRRLSGLKAEVEEWRSLQGEARSIDDLIVLALEEQDESLAASLVEDVGRVSARVKELEFKLVLSGEHDRRNAIVSLHAGAGGVESQDWVEMLVRMYVRWAEGRGFKAQTLDVSPGEEAGFKSAVVQMSGDYAYGYLRSERGVHRLVRMSPFDADHARHTSFALVGVLPEAEEGSDVAVDPADLKIEVFKAGGAGGQSVQKNSTAVRITHLPTGIKASCQNERSQYQNKAIAMRILLARLMELDMKQKAEDVAKLKGAHVSAEGGNQIRSYVLHPYKMVKDHRTDFETSDADGVLDGVLDGFINAYLTHTLGDGQESRQQATADR
jgi:peptide chain release factor 2